MSSPSTWLRNATRFAIPDGGRIRRAIALSAVVLATGGLVLFKAPASAFPGGGGGDGPRVFAPFMVGRNSTSFSGPGARGVVSLSHGSVLAGSTTTVYADVRLQADRAELVNARASISMAVVLDTSGSMSGEKIEEAKRSVLRLVGDMRDDDEIAVVRYSDSSELLQPLARVGDVRGALTSRIRTLAADGGTNIPGGLSHALRALEEADRGRVKRIVLVSDGLDGTRVQAESLARRSFSSGITVSSLGIGLDFDESYLGSLAQSGHGNFAFVKDGASLASFLHRELEETSATTIENARVRFELPVGTRVVSVTGADARVDDGTLDLAFGSLFAGDERRAVVELAVSGRSSMEIETHASWSRVGGGPANLDAPRLRIVPVTSLADVEASRDGAVLASATSVIASKRQIEAANAYAKGDVDKAAQIASGNERALDAVIRSAPAPMAATVRKQREAYGEAKKGFAAVAPSSEQGRAAAKAATEKDLGNLSRSVY